MGVSVRVDIRGISEYISLTFTAGSGSMRPHSGIAIIASHDTPLPWRILTNSDARSRN